METPRGLIRREKNPLNKSELKHPFYLMKLFEETSGTPARMLKTNHSSSAKVYYRLLFPFPSHRLPLRR